MDAKQQIIQLAKRLQSQSNDEEACELIRNFAKELLNEISLEEDQDIPSAFYRFLTGEESAKEDVLQVLSTVDAQPPYRLLMVFSSDVAQQPLEETISAFFPCSFAISDVFANDRIMYVLLYNDDATTDSDGYTGFQAVLESDLMADVSMYISPSGTSVDSLPRLLGTLSDIYRIHSKRHMEDRKVFMFEDVMPALLMDGISPELRQNIKEHYATAVEAITKLDAESRRTAELFFRNNLNITDTAKALYLHRNTLVYRLERIQKEMGLDLRRFDHSWLFNLLL